MAIGLMSSRRRKEERERQGVSITAFLYGGEERGSSRGSSTTTSKPIVESGDRLGRLESELLAFLQKRGCVSKDEVFSWGKARGFKVAEVLKVVEKLVKEGKVVKRLNESGSLVYVYAAK